MKLFKCDECGQPNSKAKVTLKGVAGTSGGILLPEYLQEQHFCCTDCFWTWVKKYDPDKETEKKN